MRMARMVLLVNGVYDLACACSILIYPFPVLSSLHSGMFVEEEHRDHPVIRRFLAYWILTYGSVRLASGFFLPSALPIAALTYFLEAFCFAHEHLTAGTLVRSKTIFVFVASAAMGVLAATHHS